MLNMILLISFASTRDPVMPVLHIVIDSIVEENWLCITRNSKFKGNNFIMKLFHQVMYPNNDIMIIDDKKRGGGEHFFN